MKRSLTVTLVMALTFFILGPFAHATSHVDQTRSDVPQLTQEQKAELNTIRQSILQKQIQLVDKYVEFGILTREEGDALISDLKKREDKWQKEQMDKTQNEKAKKEKPKSSKGKSSGKSQNKKETKDKK